MPGESTYLDHNATTPLAPEALEAMLPFLRESYGNPSSIHALGREAKQAILAARETVAAALGAGPRQVVFTAGGTEADNLAILGTLAGLEDDAPERRHVVTTKIEHHAVLYTVQQLEKRGYQVSYLAPDEDGVVSPEALREALRPDTALVSVMLANNETGALQPVAKLAELARASGARFHTDAVQAFGKLPVDVEALGVDLLALSGHKLYGPKGVGALYLRPGTPYRPVLRGGSQERSRRPGTENVAAIVGLAAATRLVQESLSSEEARLRELRDELETTVLESIPSSRVNGAARERTPNTVNFRFEGVDGEALAKKLDRAGYAVSTGAACAAGAVSPSHVLLAMGLSPEEVQGSIRVSLGRSSDASSTRAFAAALAEAVGSERHRREEAATKAERSPAR